jgi:hypothetical protein
MAFSFLFIILTSFSIEKNGAGKGDVRRMMKTLPHFILGGC